MDTQYSTPLVVDALADAASVHRLTRVSMTATGASPYDEAWLQRLIMRHPNLLPIDQLEPALVPLIPVCTELPTPSGYIDNLFVTPNGGLILAECKLWRNPEARREVVAQIIDYAKDVSRWTYESLETAINKASTAQVSETPDRLRLYDLVKLEPEMEEDKFVDSVSRNLKRGRFLLLIVGDGIQEGVESMADFLQQHAGLHFTLGLVSLGIFELPNRQFLVQPRIVARTTNIDRGIVTIKDGAISVMPPALQAVGSSGGKRTTISEEQFYENLAETDPALPVRLQAFLKRAESLGVFTETGTTSLLLRWRPNDFTKWSLGYIYPNGAYWTDTVNSPANSAGLLDLSRQFLSDLAAIIEGGFVKKVPTPTSWYVATTQGVASIGDVLKKEDQWIAAIERFMTAVKKALAQ
jgi:hypothetical protein